MKKIIKWMGIGLVALLLIFAVTIGPSIYRVTVGFHRYETAPATLPPDLTENAILIFSKTNGFRHEDAIPAANQALMALAKQNSWSTYSTEDAGVFNPQQLARFKVTVWNNTSGDVLTVEQREAFKNYIVNGGGFVGIHAAGGDLKYEWPWYVETLIGAQFTGHPLNPHIQQATLHIENGDDPIAHALGETWIRSDEWYSFAVSPRKDGVFILATIDEKTYQPKMFGTDLHMGADHPLIWKHCVGKGRVFYSALGHTSESYSEPTYLGVLERAIAWSAGFDEGTPCP